MMENYVGFKTQREMVINRKRTMTKFGSGCVDDVSAISQKLAEKVYGKAIILEKTAIGEDDSEKQSSEGQAGLIRGGKLKESGKTNSYDSDDDSSVSSDTGARYIVTPVTARHNIESKHVNGHFECFERANIRVAHTDAIRTVSFEEGGWQRTSKDMLVVDYHSGDAIVSPFWLDFAWGEQVENPQSFMTMGHTSFPMVRADFQLMGGEQIGIVVSRRASIKESAHFPDTDELLRVFGSKNKPNVHTGEILGVAKDGSFFAHNINTYERCSGAVVFLLDQKQPDHVAIQDYGKAIAIHGGGSLLSHRNYAYTIHNEFYKM